METYATQISKNGSKFVSVSFKERTNIVTAMKEFIKYKIWYEGSLTRDRVVYDIRLIKKMRSSDGTTTEVLETINLPLKNIF